MNSPASLCRCQSCECLVPQSESWFYGAWRVNVIITIWNFYKAAIIISPAIFSLKVISSLPSQLRISIYPSSAWAPFTVLLDQCIWPMTSFFVCFLFMILRNKTLGHIYKFYKSLCFFMVEIHLFIFQVIFFNALSSWILAAQIWGPL